MQEMLEGEFDDSQIQNEMGLEDCYNEDLRVEEILNVRNYFSSPVALEEILMHVSNNIDEYDPLRSKIQKYLSRKRGAFPADRQKEIGALQDQLASERTLCLIKKGEYQGEKKANQIIKYFQQSIPSVETGDQNKTLREQIRGIYQQISVLESELAELGKVPELRFQGQQFMVVNELSKKHSALLTVLDQLKKDYHCKVSQLKTLQNRVQRCRNTLKPDGYVESVSLKTKTNYVTHRQPPREIPRETKFTIADKVVPTRVYYVVGILLVVVHVIWRNLSA